MMNKYKYYYIKGYHEVFKYCLRGNIRYGFRVRYRIDHKNHEKSERGFRNLSDAIKIFKKVKALKKKDSAHITIKAFCDYYLNIIKPPVRKITTYKNYSSILTHHIIPAIGSLKLIQLNLNTYQNKVINHLFKEGLSRRTISEANDRFQAVINYAVKNHYLASNPIRFVRISNVNYNSKNIIMNDTQLNKFNHVLNNHSLQYQIMFYSLELTGMRIGEFLGLRWVDVDLNKHLIHIRHTRDVYGLRSTKTSQSNRIFTIPDKLDNLLRKYHDYCKDYFDITKLSYVLLGKHGKKLMPNIISVLLVKLLKESGLNSLVNKFTPNSFRHMFVSRLIDAGVKPTLVSKMVGHSSVFTTLCVYTNSVPNEMLNMNEALDKVKVAEKEKII